MSIRIMSLVWQSGPSDPMQKLVLLAIADHADDNGRAFPSMAGIAAKCSLTERGARAIIRKLEGDGWLDTKVGGGRGGKSHYTVNPEPQTRNHKPGMTNPECERPKTRNVTALNPEPRSAEPSRTIIEPSNNARGVLLRFLRPETADAFIEHRKAKRAKLTDRAAELIERKLANCRDPDAVVEKSIMNGWTGVFPEGNGNEKPANKSQDRLSAFIAGARGAS